jgi:uncharacterized protein (TIGR02145 family)
VRVNVFGLQPNTTYYFQISAVNSAGAEGPKSATASATTQPISVSPVTAAPANVAAQTVSASAIGLSWTAVPNADGYKIYRSLTGSGYDSVGVTATTSYEDPGLSANTTYYYRVAGYNSAGNGPESNTTVSARTLPAGGFFFTDSRDNDKKYKAVKIGDQVWMGENLNYQTSNSWCYSGNNDNCAAGYGRLYTWAAANSACPVGWHLPTDEEWDVLVNYISGPSTAGQYLMASSFGGNDEHGFSAVGGGSRNSSGSFNNMYLYGYWWTVTESGTTDASYRYMRGGYSYVSGSTTDKGTAYSVRCVQDSE